MRTFQCLRSAAVAVVVGAILASTSLVSADLVGYWPMDELGWSGTPGEVTDASGAGNDGKAGNGAITTSAGRLGRAGLFDGVNDYVAIPSDPSLVLGNHATVALWVRFNDLQLPQTTHRILGTPLYRHGLLLNQYGTTYAVYWTSVTGGPQKWMNNIFTKDLDQWYHLAVVNNAGALSVYVDGQLQSGAALAGANTFDQQELWIGGPNTWEISGVIDDVAIWNNPLDGAKVRSIYTAAEDLGLGYNIGDMVALWGIYDSGVDGSIHGIPWQFTSSLPDLPTGGPPALGDAYLVDGVMYLALGNGTGLAAVPEPSAFLIAAFGLPGLGLVGRRTRRRRVAQA